MKQNTIVCVFGEKGTGKSFHLRRLLLGTPNTVYMDFLGEYSPGIMTRNEFDRVMPGYTRTSDLREVLRRISPASAFNPFARARRPFRIVFHPAAGLHARIEHLQAVWAALKARFVAYKTPSNIVLDETQLLMKGSYAPEILRELPAVGRHFLLNQFYATRRPAELPRMASSQADHIYVFRTNEPIDVKYLQGVFPRDAVSVITRLANTQYAHLDRPKSKLTWLMEPAP